MTTNARPIFGKVGRIASEEVVLQLLISKCIPILLYGLQLCPLEKSVMSSLDFVINRFLMKMFNTSNMDIVKSCQLILTLICRVLCGPSVQELLI